MVLELIHMTGLLINNHAVLTIYMTGLLHNHADLTIYMTGLLHNHADLTIHVFIPENCDLITI